MVNKREERTYFYISEAIKLIAGVDADTNIEDSNLVLQEKLWKSAKKFIDAWRDNRFEVWGKLAGMQTNSPYEIIPVGHSLDEDVEFDYINDKIRVPALPTRRGSLSPYEKIWDRVKVERSKILKIRPTKKKDSDEETKNPVGRPSAEDRIIAALKTCTPEELQLDIAKELAPLVAEKCGQKIGDRGFSTKTLSRHISANI